MKGATYLIVALSANAAIGYVAPVMHRTIHGLPELPEALEMLMG